MEHGTNGRILLGMFSLRKIRLGFVTAFWLFSAKAVLAAGTTLIPEEGGDYDSLAEKFKSGKFELYDLGTYVQYLIEVLIFFAGGISVLFIVIGGYKYMIGAVSDDKEAGKKTIGYALMGFVISVLAWTIVNVIQVWVTSGG